MEEADEAAFLLSAEPGAVQAGVSEVSFPFSSPGSLTAEDREPLQLLFFFCSLLLQGPSSLKRIEVMGQALQQI